MIVLAYNQEILLPEDPNVPMYVHKLSFLIVEKRHR